MKEKSLQNYLFSYVCDIEPAKNIDGSIKEFYPEKNYEGKYKLNKYGNGPFCRFSIPSKWSGIMGVYALYFNEQLKYIGQCIDLAKRYNLGYGQIQSRNCFVNGQSTNCKINKLILNAVKDKIKVELYFYETNCYDEIESKLIEHYTPAFNEKGGKYSLKGNIEKDKTKYTKNINNAIKPSSSQLSVNDVYNYILKIFQNAKAEGLKYIELISGDIHRDLGLVQRMPTVCSAMYKLKKPNDIIIYSPPKGKGSKLHIKYYL